MIFDLAFCRDLSEILKEKQQTKQLGANWLSREAMQPKQPKYWGINGNYFQDFQAKMQNIP